jgi:hypothetical protein
LKVITINPGRVQTGKPAITIREKGMPERRAYAVEIHGPSRLTFNPNSTGNRVRLETEAHVEVTQ